MLIDQEGQDFLEFWSDYILYLDSDLKTPPKTLVRGVGLRRPGVGAATSQAIKGLKVLQKSKTLEGIHVSLFLEYLVYV